MELKPGYKMTEVGVIPEDWEVKPLSAVSSMKSGEGITASRIDQHSQYPCYGGNGLRGFTSRYTHDGAFALIGRQGALCGNVVGVSGKLFASEHTVVVTPRQGTNVEFLTYVLGEMHLNRLSEASAQPGLSVSKILQLSIATPPTETEQRAIAQALSDVDALLATLDQVIAKKRDLKQAAMQQLLTGKTRLPGFSGAWETQQLKVLAHLSKTGINPSSTPESLFTHFSLPAFDANESPVIESGASIGSNKFIVPPGAVLLSKLNPRIPRVWAPNCIPSNSVCSTEFLVLIPNEGVDRNFFKYLCASTAVASQMELHAIGTTGSHQRIHPTQVMAIEVKTPTDDDERSAISSVLRDIDAELSNLNRRRDKTVELKQAMMQELLTGKTRLI